MVEPIGYAERLQKAMEDARKNVHALAGELGVSYQAVQKVLRGTSKALSAYNNAKAAKFLGVESDWLATGEGRRQRRGSVWPFSPDLLTDVVDLDDSEIRRAENLLRAHLELPPLPRDRDDDNQHFEGRPEKQRRHAT